MQLHNTDRKKMIQQGFVTVAAGYTCYRTMCKEAQVSRETWMSGATKGFTGNAGMYRKYGSRVTQDAVTESNWQ